MTQDRGFESAFWPAYPRKVGKGQARTAYARALKKTTHAEIMAGLARYRASLNGTEQRYIRHATTWLNGEGWLDEYEPVKPSERPIPPDEAAAIEARWAERVTRGEAVPDGIIRGLVAKGLVDQDEAKRRGVQLLPPKPNRPRQDCS